MTWHGACRVRILAAVGLLFTCGCPPMPPHDLAIPRLTDTPPAPQGMYLLQLGDTIAVKFYQNPDLDEDVVVRPDGMISLQLVGDVQAAGKSPMALASELGGLYASELSVPKVSVIVRQFGGARVFVSGEVGTQGVLQMGGGLTLYQAIKESGGFLLTAYRSQVLIIRGVHERKPTAYSVDMAEVEDGQLPGNDVLLQPYDMIFVPKTPIAHIDDFVDQYFRKALPINPTFLLF